MVEINVNCSLIYYANFISVLRWIGWVVDFINELYLSYKGVKMRSFILVVIIALSFTGCSNASKVDPELDNIAHLI